MKKMAMICLVFAILAACGDKSPTAPSTGAANTAPTIDLSKVVVLAIQRFASGNTVVVNLYGNVQLGLREFKDPNGAMIRLREYSTGKRVTYLTTWANSSPIGNSNDTIIRDIATGGNIDMALYMEPYTECKPANSAPACWVPFSFPNLSQAKFIPEKQYKLNSVDGEIRIQGDLPGVGSISVIGGFVNW